ncbi:MAG TPA: GNAT family N-acetyltransferase [Acidimicrobiia bacterium]|jgi:GNAT superfamily N-acetyltransferase
MEARIATPGDFEELIRMGAVMLSSMGIEPDVDTWHDRAVEVLRAELASGTAAAFVVDAPDQPGQLIASGVVLVHQRLPTAENPDGRVGHVQWVATERAHRRKGLATVIMRAIIDWLCDREIEAVELYASTEGAPLYASLGFVTPERAWLRLRLAP